jgi:maleamate amidohydrolase
VTARRARVVPDAGATEPNRVAAGESHCWDDLVGDEERIVLAGYSLHRSFESRRALLLIDLYNKAFGMRDEPLAQAVRSYPSSCGRAGWRALPVQRELLDRARRAGVPVVYTVAEPAHHRWGPATLRAGADRPGTGASAEWDDQIVAPLAPRDDDVVVSKTRASAFFATPLDSVLRRLGVEALVVAGETTSGCVRASVVDAFSLGFDVAVVEEATFDRSPASHKLNLFDMHCKYATVLPAESAYALLDDPRPAVLVP